MTPETYEPANDGGQIDATVGTAKRLLVMAYGQYNEATKDGAHHRVSYWDGYIRGIQHILEAQHE
jgi:hypothetical protein